MNTLSIGEVARRARVRPSALRYYEKVGLVAPPPREHGRRRYAPTGWVSSSRRGHRR